MLRVLLLLMVDFRAGWERGAIGRMDRLRGDCDRDDDSDAATAASLLWQLPLLLRKKSFSSSNSSAFVTERRRASGSWGACERTCKHEEE